MKMSFFLCTQYYYYIVYAIENGTFLVGIRIDEYVTDVAKINACVSFCAI